MAKASKKAAPKKVAKKAAPKAKPAAKGKTAKPAKPSKPAAKTKPAAKVKPSKPTPAKKVAEKKPEPKATKAKVVKAVKESAKAKKAAIEAKKAAAAPDVNMQLTIFSGLNQRPIAHKSKTAPVNDGKTRYSDDELTWFDGYIRKKLDKAKEEFKILKDTLNRTNDEGTDSTSGGNTKVLEDGAETAEKENLSQLAARQQKYIANLENALVRIKNRTYGICVVTGKLIPKERLVAVPHTTQSIEAKMMKKD